MALTWANRPLTEPTEYTEKKQASEGSVISVIPVRGKTIIYSLWAPI